MSEKADMAARREKYGGYSLSATMVRIILTLILLTAGIVFAWMAYGYITDGAQMAYNPQAHSSDGGSYIKILNPYSFVLGAVFGTFGVFILLFSIYLWGDDTVFYRNYLESKHFVEDPRGDGITVYLKGILFRMVDRIDNKAICGILLLTASWIGLSLIFAAGIGVGAAMVTSIYALIAGVVLVPVFLYVLSIIIIKRGKRYYEKKEEEKYEVKIK